jgi:subtilisin family serine protease
MPLSEAVTFTFLIEDADGNPVHNAGVYVTGSGWPAHAITGPTGKATVTMPGETTETIRSVVVRPVSGHWSARLERPALSTAHDNLVTLQSLSESFPGFPDQQAFGWGQRAMHLHRLPPTFRAGGIRIAVIDSGVSTEHPDLRDQIAGGLDLVDRAERGWSVDTIYHGSRCAGIVTASDNGRGVIGIAVESLVYAVKIYPTGRLSDLIEALDYCIDEEIDIANVGLSVSRPSQLVTAKIEEARHAGVACVAAAGDGGGPVTFPGSLPTVLTVAAIGKVDTFPAGSSHAAEVYGPHTGEGYFSPRFTCHGPEVDVCAPGVAILSVAPSDGYAVWDGTFMAAAHITSIAALTLAHHGDFSNSFSKRNASRVDHLFQLIKNSCTPLELGAPHRTGAGLPDALHLLGPALAGIPAVPGEVLSLLDQLTTEMIQAGLLQTLPSLTREGLPHAQAVIPQTQPGAAATARAGLLTAPGRTALAWLAEEMRTAGLLEEFPDPLE